MNKKYLPLLLALASFASQSSGFSSNESELAELKNTPATKYELGLFKLETYVYAVNNKLEGERIGSTKFRFKNATVREDNDQIQVVVIAIGKSKYLTESKCEAVKNILSKPFNAQKMPYNMWSGLPQESYKTLQSEISLHVTLMDKKNSSSILTCK
ncbi:hypothetical protein [Moritella sp.]|uniref:hypothetical protein n=1 Tax=Moritella sp. TaxID=78556 RepID=UPI001DAE09ED|nr:hypothetical protein [Moritella sp.]MCJ8348036.1 hypothetical protein [Moritella sp.]NQZ42627.1 hypothetical protein [Moritella sp.]